MHGVSEMPAVTRESVVPNLILTDLFGKHRYQVIVVRCDKPPDMHYAIWNRACSKDMCHGRR